MDKSLFRDFGLAFLIVCMITILGVGIIHCVSLSDSYVADAVWSEDVVEHKIVNVFQYVDINTAYGIVNCNVVSRDLTNNILNCNFNGSSGHGAVVGLNFNFILGHKLLFLFDFDFVDNNLFGSFYLRGDLSGYRKNLGNDVELNYCFFDSLYNGVDSIGIAFTSSYTYTSTLFSITNYQLFDLTSIYGAGNEPTTLSEFRYSFPSDYYSYGSHVISNDYNIGYSDGYANGSTGNLTNYMFPSYYMNFLGDGPNSVYASDNCFVNCNGVYNVFKQFDFDDLTITSITNQGTYVGSWVQAFMQIYKGGVQFSNGASSGATLNYHENRIIGQPTSYTIESYEICINGVFIYRKELDLHYTGESWKNSIGDTLSLLLPTGFATEYTASGIPINGYNSRTLTSMNNNNIYRVIIPSGNGKLYYPTALSGDYTNIYGNGFYFGLSSSDYFADAISESYNLGKSYGKKEGYNNGYDIGFSEGFDAGENASHEYSFTKLFGAVVDAPISVLFGSIDSSGNRTGGLFGVTIFNTDMRAFFGALLSIGIIIVLLKLFLH